MFICASFFSSKRALLWLTPGRSKSRMISAIGIFSRVVLRGPTEQAEEIDQRLGQKPPSLVFLDQRPLVALRHLARPVLFQDERDVGIDRQRRAEGPEKLGVLARVRQVVLPADHMGDLHRDVVDHIHEMEHRTAVGADDDEVLLLRALHPAADGIVDDLRLARDPEKDGSVLLVGAAGGLQPFQVLPVDRPPVRSAGTARMRRPARGSLVPVRPSQEGCRRSRSGTPRCSAIVGVLDAQDEGPARVPGVEPVEERRPGAADVEEPGGAGGETNADLWHVEIPWLPPEPVGKSHSDGFPLPCQRLPPRPAAGRPGAVPDRIQQAARRAGWRTRAVRRGRGIPARGPDPAVAGPEAADLPVGGHPRRRAGGAPGDPRAPRVRSSRRPGDLVSLPDPQSRRVRPRHPGESLGNRPQPGLPQSRSPEIRSHLAWLGRQPGFDLTLCLHEDWESKGYYVYERNPSGRPSLAGRILEAASPFCPRDTDPVIDGWEAEQGVIRPPGDPFGRELWPETIFLSSGHTKLAYTFETPRASRSIGGSRPTGPPRMPHSLACFRLRLSYGRFAPTRFAKHGFRIQLCPGFDEPFSRFGRSDRRSDGRNPTRPRAREAGTDVSRCIP